MNYYLNTGLVNQQFGSSVGISLARKLCKKYKEKKHGSEVRKFRFLNNFVS